MDPVICHFRDAEGNVTYLRADKDATRATVDQVTPEEVITLHRGDYDETLSVFTTLAGQAGGLEPGEIAKMDAFHQTIERYQKTEEEVTDERPVDTGAARGTREDNPKGIRGFAPWRIHGRGGSHRAESTS